VTLLVDIGNSRVKWARLGPDGVIGEQSAAAYADWSAEDWRHALFGVAPAGRVLAASVAGDSTDAALIAAADLAGGRAVQFVAATREAAGVRNGYADPGLLGVDRWVAVIGAYARVRGACVVADLGTAATVDVLTADGSHLGGYIVPGPALMVASLLRSTSDLDARHAAGAVARSQGLFADNTRDAIERGGRMALAALVDRCVKDAGRGAGQWPRLLVTGGAAAEVLPHLETPAEHVPDLVLRGLAQLARGPLEP
jgi:type III pantothenate kinase